MGTTLTGTTPQDTYDSLIKVTDNGPLSGSLKKLTDGLGNDSSLSLSTTAASLSGTLAVAGAATLSSTLSVSGDTTLSGASGNRTLTIQTNTSGSPVLVLSAAGDDGATITYNRGLNYLSIGVSSVANAMAIRTSGNVGIGTSSPESKLHVAGGNIRVGTALDNTTYSIGKATAGAETFRGAVQFASNTTTDNVAFITHETGVFSGEVARFTGTQYLRFASGSGGIQFNGDTAAANALDDYEEGTFTPTLNFDGNSVGITYIEQAGKYTKIGNKVSFAIVISLSSKGSSTGNARIAGLPFNISPSSGADFIPFTIGAFVSITFADVPAAVGITNNNYFVLDEMVSGAPQTALTNADFSNSSFIRVSGFYFV